MIEITRWTLLNSVSVRLKNICHYSPFTKFMTVTINTVLYNLYNVYTVYIGYICDVWQHFLDTPKYLYKTLTYDLFTIHQDPSNTKYMHVWLHKVLVMPMLPLGYVNLCQIFWFNWKTLHLVTYRTNHIF